MQEEGAPFDLRNSEDQERIFADDLAERKPFYERMNRASPGRGDLEMARDIEQWRQDTKKLTRSVARYLQGDRAENLIVVFDNVDRRDSDSQLAAFQSALWFMDQTRCLIILQMRDATFEAFKKEPPLDTYKTGQIFHISPPRFVDVVKKRLELSLKELESLSNERVSFRTNSGATFTYPKDRAGEFLLGIYRELFESRSNLSRLLEALAGRNVRQALDMFMTIITSGHLPEEVLVSVAQGRGFEQFPQYLILRALMRRDYRFFSDETEFICNILYCENSWKRPSNLLLPEVIFSLLGQRKARGDNGQMGFVAIPRLKEDMEQLGFVQEDVHEALIYALRKGLIEADTSSTKTLRERDCVKSTASAWAHLRVLASRIEYLWAVLPTTPLSDEELANSVFDLMQIEARHGSLYLAQMSRSVALLKRYLTAQAAEQAKFPGFTARSRSGTTYLLAKMDEAMNYARREQPKPTGQIDWLDV